MRALATVYVAASGVALFWATTQTDARVLGGLALAVSALWVLTAVRARSGSTALFTALVVIAAVTAASGAGVILPAAAVTLSLLGWDACLAAARLRGIPPRDSRPLQVRYAASCGAIGLASFAVLLALHFVHVPLSFGLAVGLTVVLVSLAVGIALWTRPKPGDTSTHPPDETETESPTKAERKAGQLSLPDSDESKPS